MLASMDGDGRRLHGKPNTESLDGLASPPTTPPAVDKACRCLENTVMSKPNRQAMRPCFRLRDRIHRVPFAHRQCDLELALMEAVGHREVTTHLVETRPEKVYPRMPLARSRGSVAPALATFDVISVVLSSCGWDVRSMCVSCQCKNLVLAGAPS